MNPFPSNHIIGMDGVGSTLLPKVNRRSEGPTHIYSLFLDLHNLQTLFISDITEFERANPHI